MEKETVLTTKEIFEKYIPNDEVLTQENIFEIEQNMIGLFTLLDKLDRKYFPENLKDKKDLKQ